MPCAHAHICIVRVNVRACTGTTPACECTSVSHHPLSPSLHTSSITLVTVPVPVYRAWEDVEEEGWGVGGGRGSVRGLNCKSAAFCWRPSLSGPFPVYIHVLMRSQCRGRIDRSTRGLAGAGERVRRGGTLGKKMWGSAYGEGRSGSCVGVMKT